LARVGLTIERCLYFTAKKTLSEYAEEADRLQRINRGALTGEGRTALRDR
jgi:hypothetical protein